MAEEKRTTRRDFLKGTGAVGGMLAGASVLIGFERVVPAPAVKPEVAATAKEVPPAIGYVELDPEICAGCRTCEAVCSLSHDGVVSPALARIWVVDHILEGRRIEGYTCKQCDGPECVYSCPSGAIYADEVTGARVIDPDKCIGAKLCITACPMYPNTPIRFDAQRNIAVKCDLCDGDPLCVKFCPEGALTFVKKEA
jgi:Fe-S-cluster-containing hydrogenase component 2